MLATIEPFDVTILKQDALAREKSSRNGIQKDVSVVAKGLAFMIDLTTNTSMNFHNCRVWAKLFYDSDDEEYKPCELPKSDPLTYKVFISACGDRASVECRIYVLTSQHENALFRVKLGVEYGAQVMELVSEPIRVLSKPSQIQKEKRKRAGSVCIAPDTPIPSTPIASTCPKKITGLELSMMETLQRLEETQKEQKVLIEKLVRSQKLDNEDDGEFESAFSKFLCAWNKLPTEERPNKMRKVISSAPDSFANFLHTCALPEVVAKAPLSLSQILLDDYRSHNEPGVSLKEQEAWDSLYANYTWSPESDAKEPEQ